jgi:hypothetical protein
MHPAETNHYLLNSETHGPSDMRGLFAWNTWNATTIAESAANMDQLLSKIAGNGRNLRLNSDFGGMGGSEQGMFSAWKGFESIGCRLSFSNSQPHIWFALLLLIYEITHA